MDYLQYAAYITRGLKFTVLLNLIINGLPSILQSSKSENYTNKKRAFKPYYKWITFNTIVLTIIGIGYWFYFKPYYKWITFNTKLN